MRQYIALWACCTIGFAACAADTTLQGAGATFPAPLYAKWVDEFNAHHANIRVDYQPIGSGGGIKGITDRTIDFAGSDAPMTDEQLKEAPAPILHIPAVSGPVVLTYNLPEVKELTLNGEVLADIFLGKVKQWNDPKIAALNQNAKLPDTEIYVVHRSDGSGTSWIFTNYLSKVSPVWKEQVGNATSVHWPVGIGGKGNAGVAKAVQTTYGSIGYVELAYAKSGGLPFAAQINKAGKRVVASIPGVIAAAKNSENKFPDDLRVSITDAPGDDSYPICGFTYLLIYKDLSYLGSEEKAQALLTYIQWGLHEGQKFAEPDYAPLPADAQSLIAEKLKSVTFNGKEVQPTLTATKP
jgi:phosphate transport system substrate-binding protein